MQIGIACSSKRANRSLPLAAAVVLLVAAMSSRAAPQFSTLHSFTGEDGINPNSLLWGWDGGLYGVAINGGSENHGTVFRITPSGRLSILHAFSSAPGSGPNGPITLAPTPDGKFVGRSVRGGYGNVGGWFEITRSGNYTVRLEFAGSYAADYSSPVGGYNGTLYGANLDLGPKESNGSGIIFSLSDSGEKKVIHAFNGADGNGPEQLLRGTDGSLYGVTVRGGVANAGTIFRVDPAGQFSTLYSFSANGKAAGPICGLSEGSDRSLYGLTCFGGDNNLGTVFKLDSEGKYSTLYSFKGFADSGNPDGAYPVFLTAGFDGNLYGVTDAGGSSGEGAAFKIAPDGTESVLYSFPVSNSGGQPLPSSIVLGADGNLYGTTQYGGSRDKGAIFRIVQTPPAPANLVSRAGQGEILLSWNASLGATSYKVYMGTSPGTESPDPLLVVSGRRTVVKGLSANHSYYFYVTAANGAGDSGASAEVSAIPR